MSETSPSLVEFYRRHGISPVGQDISNLETHFTRRGALYRHLGLLPEMFHGRSVVEIGPGSGFNSVFTASLGPRRYVLVEGNPRGVADIDRLFTQYGLRDRIEIVPALVEDYAPDEPFEFVLCEGMLALAGVPDPVALMRQVARLVAPGGVLVITTIDALSDFAETLRRLFAHLLLDPEAPLAEQSARLTPVFGPHLATLAGMSRPHNDWVVDNLLNPASIGPYLSIPEAVAGLGDDFEVYGTSPRFLTDWRWYKDIVPGATRYNVLAVEQYWQHAHNLLDHRRLFPARAAEDNQRLYAAAIDVRDLIRAFETTRDRAIVTMIQARLADMAGMLAAFSDDIAGAVLEARDLLAGGHPDADTVARATRFGPWFGRGQQYLSLHRSRAAGAPGIGGGL